MPLRRKAQEAYSSPVVTAIEAYGADSGNREEATHRRSIHGSRHAPSADWVNQVLSNDLYMTLLRQAGPWHDLISSARSK
jgi:hypothetical protein